MSLFGGGEHEARGFLSPLNNQCYKTAVVTLPFDGMIGILLFVFLVTLTVHTLGALVIPKSSMDSSET